MAFERIIFEWKSKDINAFRPYRLIVYLNSFLLPLLLVSTAFFVNGLFSSHFSSAFSIILVLIVAYYTYWGFPFILFYSVKLGRDCIVIKSCFNKHQIRYSQISHIDKIAFRELSCDFVLDKWMHCRPIIFTIDDDKIKCPYPIDDIEEFISLVSEKIQSIQCVKSDAGNFGDTIID